MNRRDFVKTLAAAVIATPSFTGLNFYQNQMPNTFNGLDVEEDGILSLHGQSLFPTFGESGGLMAFSTRYRLKDTSGFVYAERISFDGKIIACDRQRIHKDWGLGNA